ncbi:MAG TPA: HAD-IA family hydrolase [Actinomycetota bacterium]|nr:HAD-IA family hydrolase [Actinomycetota bacterium]
MHERRVVRAVLLDLYDTLVWTEWPKLRDLIEQRTDLSRRDLLAAFDRTRRERSVGAFDSMEGDLRAVLRAAGVEDADDQAPSLAELATRFLEDGVHLWDDSLPVLRELRSRGIRTAVVSNCDHGTRPVVERLGLHEEADAVVLSFEVGVAKPDPKIYGVALDVLDARAQESLFVDDQARYCDGAAALGIGTYIVLRHEAAPGEGVSNAGAHPVLRDLGSLLDLI